MLQRDADGATTPALKIRLGDYQAPTWRIAGVELVFDLDIASTEVYARLELESADATPAPLRLDGEGLELIELRLDGKRLGPADYHVDVHALQLPKLPARCVLESRVRIHPQANTTLEGLYLSGSAERGFLLTQCEAQGFRHITYFLDRPDVLTRYSVELRADAARFPVLLAGGNAVGSGALADGRHWARFDDPHPRPAYLFALVAGRLQCIEQPYTTAEGRAVTLKLWAEADAIAQCRYALGALQHAMRWDERVYGRNYDLDVFHVVATHDFNMGAMENKGLNIFNAKYLLADADTTTDEGFRAVEAVVAHEYFHNWSGNRVTCRDWFQLSLKEGFTVFREQCFSADMHSHALKRIEDVATLRRAQFPEDAGPLAHPVRPAEYAEINNFYTATVYEKGAELIRMLAARLGSEAFRHGTDLYFARHDGSAATVEDLLAALGEAAGVDLTPYLAWYAQAGTPRLSARCHYEPATRRYVLRLAQHTAPTPGQPDKRPLPIPLKLALFARDGRMLPLRLAGEAAPAGTERVVELTDAAAEFVFEDIDEAPIPSLLRGFSAPVILDDGLGDAERLVLLAHDPDPFNRWESAQRLALAQLLPAAAGEALQPDARYLQALRAVLRDSRLDPAFQELLLTLPGEGYVAEQLTLIDPPRIHAVRQQLRLVLARELRDDWERVWRELAPQGGYSPDFASSARRGLRNLALACLCLDGDAQWQGRAYQLVKDADNMTDRLAGLSALVAARAELAQPALQRFAAQFAGEPLVLDKWFALQAAAPGVEVQAVRDLLRHPDFTLRNPNRARSVISTFCQANPGAFHRADGAGYAFWAEQVRALDAINPQVAARLARALDRWRKLAPPYAQAAEAAIRELAGHDALSSDCREILDKALA